MPSVLDSNSSTTIVAPDCEKSVSMNEATEYPPMEEEKKDRV